MIPHCGEVLWQVVENGFVVVDYCRSFPVINIFGFNNFSTEQITNRLHTETNTKYWN